MKLKRLIFITSSVLMFSAWTPAYAGTECLFTAKSSLDLKYTSGPAIQFTNIQAPPSGYRQIGEELPFSSTSQISSTCNNGNDGQALKSRADATGNSLDQYTELSGKQVLLYDTTVPGIYYAIKIYNNECTDNQGYIPPDKSNVWLADVGDDREKACMKPGTFSFKVLFFVGTKYKPVAQHETFNSKVPATHGYFLLSGAEDDAKKNEVHVKMVQFTGGLN